MLISLWPGNVLLYAAKAYEKPNCLQSEFREDFKRIQYLNRLLMRYQNDGELRERLVLNHLIVLYNVFGLQAATRLLFYYIKPQFYTTLKTFLVFLNYCPDEVCGIRDTDIMISTMGVDLHAVAVLRQIK